MPELKFIRLSDIRVNPVALREANRQSDSFAELTNSIRREGVMSAVSVRHMPGEDGKQYQLVDGLQRFSASQEAGTGVVDLVTDEKGTRSVGKYEEGTDSEGKPTKIGVIPAQVIERGEADTLISQIAANAHRIETQPTEYAKAIFKYLGYNPTMTITEVAAKINKNPVWLEKQLGLLKLHETLKPLVDGGKIVLANAYTLAKLPPDEQLNWSERAQTQDSNTFNAAALARIKEIRDANKKGRDVGEEKFIPVAHIRKKSELEAEISKPEMGPALIRDLEVTKGIKPNNDGLLQAAQAGYQLGLQWALMLDAKSIEVQKQKYEDQKKKDEEQKARRNAEKEAKKAAETAEKAKEAEALSNAARAAATA